MTTITKSMIDAAGRHLRETMQAGKNLNPWEQTPNATKKKWLALAEGTLTEALRHAETCEPVVKPLDWRGRFGNWFGLLYVISEYEGGAILEKRDGSSTMKSAWPSEDDAKAAAQADFEARIRSALTGGGNG